MHIASILLIGIDRPDLRASLEQHGYSLLPAGTIDAAEAIETAYDLTLIDVSLVSAATVERLYFLNQNTPVLVCAANPASVPRSLTGLCRDGTLACAYYDEIPAGLIINRIDRELLAHRLNRTITQAQQDRYEKEQLQRDISLHSRVADHERELNANIIASIGSGMVIIDPAGMIMLANAPARRLLGRPDDDIVGAPFRSAFPPEMVAAAERLLARAPAAALSVERVNRNDQYLQVTGNRMLDARGAFSGFLLFIQDITEQEAMAAQLYRSEKLATIGTMLSGISHELRNPLAIISARCQRLRARGVPEPDQLTKGLESIETQAGRCANIVNHLLDFTRHTATAPGYHRIAEIFDETLTYVDYQNVFDNIVVEKEYGPDLDVFGDRSRLVQAFLNIITNAADAMNGSGVLSIATRADGRNYVVADINDNGPGIPPAAQKKIFDPFFTTKDPGKGTGLGLAIVQKIIQESGGAIWFDSGPGDTTFHIRLPSLKERLHEE